MIFGAAACIADELSPEAEEALREIAELPITKGGFENTPKVVFISDESTKFTDEDPKVVNEVQLWKSDAFDFWLLRQSGFGHGLYGIYVKKDVAPPIAVYIQLFELDEEPFVRGASCYRCHASGPRAIRPFIPDTASLPGETMPFDLRLSTEARAQIRDWNETIAGYKAVKTSFSYEEPYEPTDPLTVRECTACHREGGARERLERSQAFSIGNLVHTAVVDDYFADPTDDDEAMPVMPPGGSDALIVKCVEEFVSGSALDPGCE